MTKTVDNETSANDAPNNTTTKNGTEKTEDVIYLNKSNIPEIPEHNKIKKPVTLKLRHPKPFRLLLAIMALALTSFPTGTGALMQLAGVEGAIYFLVVSVILYILALFWVARWLLPLFLNKKPAGLKNIERVIYALDSYPEVKEKYIDVYKKPNDITIGQARAIKKDVDKVLYRLALEKFRKKSNVF